MIDTKAHSGELTEGDGMLWRGRTPIRKEINGVEAQADYTRQVLGLDANPVLCFVGTRLPRPVMMVGQSRVVALEALVSHLSSTPALLTEQQIDVAFRRVEAWQLNPPAPEHRPDQNVPCAARNSLHPKPTERRRRRREMES